MHPKPADGEASDQPGRVPAGEKVNRQGAEDARGEKVRVLVS
jgi:hypothetical protein